MSGEECAALVPNFADLAQRLAEVGEPMPPELAEFIDCVNRCAKMHVAAAAGRARQEADAAYPSGAVSADEILAEFAGRSRIAQCSLCAAPVFVHDDGSTTGGVDTLVGIRCDECLNED